MSEPIIIVDNIHKSYLMGKEAVPALRGVSLEIQRGEFICLMGPSGSGKTTLLNIVGGLDEPSRGHVIVEGANLVSLSENELARLRLQKMGFIFQNYNLLGNFTAQENVEAPMVLRKMGRRERHARARELLV
ncbi:MAG: ABC transporter ATP-binding protein [Chloroflexota bacterium]